MTTAKAKKTQVKQIISRFDDGGQSYLDCTKVGEDIKHMMQSIMQGVLGYHEALRFSHIYPLSVLMGRRADIVREFGDYEVDFTSNSSKYKPVLDIIDAYETEIKSQLADKLAKGHVEFGDLNFLLEKDKEVVTSADGELIAGTIESVKLVQTFFSTYYKVQIKVISNVHGTIKDNIFETNVGYFAGFQKINSLTVRPLDDETKAYLTERGARYRKYANGVHYIQYKGQLTRNSYWSSQAFRADGRVIMDISSFQQVDNNQFSNESYQSGIESNREERNNKKIDIVIPDSDLWRTYPYLYGFSMSVKQWGRMAVSGLSDIEFRTDAFEKLVLPEEDKALVKAIVQDDSGDFSDLIDGKGGGSIFLLHGPPGQGKTLTAEAIAEELQRPLYSISVGELGTNPDSLEKTLRRILDVATVWNAVLLLDEADIFLEERDEKDIVRNAMVGVFLRLLEYHQGVLFLTTNRVKNIDQAFYSRISIGLRFGAATVEKRAKIWTNLTDAAGVQGLDLAKLAEHDLNGRQIKNVIKLAVKLARAESKPVDNVLIDSVIARTSNFSNEEQAGDNDR